MPRVNSFADTYLPSYARGKRDVGGLEYDFLYRIDILYEERKKLKRVEPYYEYYERLYRGVEEQYRPLLTYTDRGIGRTTGDRAFLWTLNEATMRYREFGDTGSFYFSRKNRKLYTKSFVRKVVRDWGYDLR